MFHRSFGSRFYGGQKNGSISYEWQKGKVFQEWGQKAEGTNCLPLDLAVGRGKGCFTDHREGLPFPRREPLSEKEGETNFQGSAELVCGDSSSEGLGVGDSPLQFGLWRCWQLVC